MYFLKLQLLFILIFLFNNHVKAQRDIDLAIKVYAPDGQYLSSNSPLTVSGVIYNLGTDTVFASDVIKIRQSINNVPIIYQPANDSFKEYQTQINPNDSFMFSINHSQGILSTLIINNPGQNQVCAWVSLDSGSAGFTADPNQANNMDCVDFYVGITHVTQANALKDVQLYPNPVKNTLHLKVDNIPDYKYVEIYDVYGKRIYYQTLLNQENSIELSQLSAGTYFIKVYDNKNHPLVKLFIKE